jgi:hypothetical protein
MRVRFIPTTALSAALANQWPSASEACANRCNTCRALQQNRRVTTEGKRSASRAAEKVHHTEDTSLDTRQA